MGTDRGRDAKGSRARSSASTGGPPSEVVASARAAFYTRDTESMLAELVNDSLDDPVADLSRRRLSFVAGGLDLVVSVTRSRLGDQSSMSIALMPMDPDTVEVQCHGQMPVRAVVDGAGRWSVTPAPAGPVRITVDVGGSKIRTSWTRL